MENVKQLHDEYRPTKHHLDLLRQSIGLEPTPDLHDEGIKLTPGVLLVTRVEYTMNAKPGSSKGFCPFLDAAE